MTYPTPSATDIVDGSVTVTCVPPSSSHFALGIPPSTATLAMRRQRYRQEELHCHRPRHDSTRNQPARPRQRPSDRCHRRDRDLLDPGRDRQRRQQRDGHLRTALGLALRARSYHGQLRRQDRRQPRRHEELHDQCVDTTPPVSRSTQRPATRPIRRPRPSPSPLPTSTSHHFPVLPRRRRLLELLQPGLCTPAWPRARTLSWLRPLTPPTIRARRPPSLGRSIRTRRASATYRATSPRIRPIRAAQSSTTRPRRRPTPSIHP